MHHIFVSYSRADTAWVQGLVARLKLRGHEVWLDQADIPVTVLWMRRCGTPSRSPLCFCRCDSATFRASSSCSAEVSLALQVFKPQFLATVGDTSTAAPPGRPDGTGDQPRPGPQRTELPRVWRGTGDRADRPRNRLMSHGVAAPEGSPARWTAATAQRGELRSFLRASRDQARRRSVIGSVTVLLTIVAVLATFVFRPRRENQHREQPGGGRLQHRTGGSQRGRPGSLQRARRRGPRRRQ